MAKYEVKFDVDGQDFLEFERGSAEEAYEAFLEEDEKELDAPIVVWLGLEKVATFKRHIGGEDDVEEEIASHGDTNYEHQPSRSFEQTNRAIEDKLDKLYDVMNHIRWIGLGIGGMFAITFVIPQCSG